VRFEGREINKRRGKESKKKEYQVDFFRIVKPRFSREKGVVNETEWKIWSEINVSFKTKGSKIIARQGKFNAVRGQKKPNVLKEESDNRKVSKNCKGADRIEQGKEDPFVREKIARRGKGEFKVSSQWKGERGPGEGKPGGTPGRKEGRWRERGLF